MRSPSNFFNVFRDMRPSNFNAKQPIGRSIQSEIYLGLAKPSPAP